MLQVHRLYIVLQIFLPLSTTFSGNTKFSPYGGILDVTLDVFNIFVSTFMFLYLCSFIYVGAFNVIFNICYTTLRKSCQA